MTEFQKSVISLVKSALTGSKTEISGDFDWNECLELARQHQILPLIFYGAHNSGISPGEDIKSLLENCLFKCVSVDANQVYELKRIEDGFQKNKIDYMPLKGSVIKFLYPKTEMRQMGDADILIREGQYDAAETVMSNLGFSKIGESDHELIWKKKGKLFVELHKRIIPSYNKDYYSYFGDGWRLARLCDGEKYKYDMSSNDTFIYLFTHFSKHYRDGGIGIRHITDLWVYKSKNPDINEEYIESQLKELSLYKFHINISKTLSVWFDGAESDIVSDFITDVIFKSGSYGTKEKHVISDAVKLSKTAGSKNIRQKKLIRVLFPDYKSMTGIYPMLNKYPCLLPVMWIARGVKTVFLRRSKLKKQSENLKLLTEKNVSEYQQSLNFVGLDFNFPE